MQNVAPTAATLKHGRVLIMRIVTLKNIMFHRKKWVRPRQLQKAAKTSKPSHCERLNQKPESLRGRLANCHNNAGRKSNKQVSSKLERQQKQQEKKKQQQKKKKQQQLLPSSPTNTITTCLFFYFYFFCTSQLSDLICGICRNGPQTDILVDVSCDTR